MAGKTMANTNTDIHRVYVYHGADDGQKKVALQKLVDSVIDSDFQDFDLENLYGPDVDADRLMLAASVAPFSSKRRMVIVSQANAMAADVQDAIAAKIADIPDTACIIFVLPAPQLQDGRPKRGSELSANLTKAAKKVGKVVDFPLMKADPATHFVADLLKENGKSVSPAVASSIVRRCGTDSNALSMEVEKLIGFVGERSTITKNDVDEVVTVTIEEKIFNLMDAVGSRTPAEATRLLRPFFQGGANPVGEALRILTMLVRHFSQLWQARVLLDMGYRAAGPGRYPEDIQSILPKDGSVLKMDDWKQKKIFNQARGFTLDEIGLCFEKMAKMDLALKGIDGAIVDAATATEVLIIELSSR